MYRKFKKPLKVFSICVETSTRSVFDVIAFDVEDARQIVSEAFGFETGFHTNDTLHQMHGKREMINFVAPNNELEEMECTVSHAIHVFGPDAMEAYENRESTVVIREGDFYSCDPEDSSVDDGAEECVDCKNCEDRNDCGYYAIHYLCEDCRQPDEKCLLYLLRQPAELIPMSSVEECSAELGTQLAHECIPDTALFITYNPCSILDVEDARYLIAPALVYGLVDNKPVAMNDEECAAAQKILAERTVTLTADGEEFHALKLWD